MSVTSESAVAGVVSLVPNALTVSRICAVLLMLVSVRESPAFWVLFLWCGFSDVADGYLARRWSVQSQFGSFLDSIADFAFIFAVLLMYRHDLLALGAVYVALVLVIAALRAGPIVLVARGMRRPETLHWNSSRYLGAFLFACPILATIAPFTWVAWAALFIALAVSMFELLFRLR